MLKLPWIWRDLSVWMWVLAAATFSLAGKRTMKSSNASTAFCAALWS